MVRMIADFKDGFHFNLLFDSQSDALDNLPKMEKAHGPYLHFEIAEAKEEASHDND